jgi:hypothetical protein
MMAWGLADKFELLVGFLHHYVDAGRSMCELVFVCTHLIYITCTSNSFSYYLYHLMIQLISGHLD